MFYTSSEKLILMVLKIFFIKFKQHFNLDMTIFIIFIKYIIHNIWTVLKIMPVIEIFTKDSLHNIHVYIHYYPRVTLKTYLPVKRIGNKFLK